MTTRVSSQFNDFNGWTVDDEKDMIKKAAAKAASVFTNILKAPEMVQLAHSGGLSVKNLCKNSGKYLSKLCLAVPVTQLSGQAVTRSDSEELAEELAELVEWAVEEELSEALDILSIYSDQKFTSAFRSTCSVMKSSLDDAAKMDASLAKIRLLVGRQRSITEAFAAATKMKTYRDDGLTRNLSVMVRDCDGLIIAAHSPGGFVTAPACLVPKLAGDPVAEMEVTHCAASELLTKILHMEVLPDHIDPAEGPSSPGETVRFVCQLDCSAADLVHHQRWMWQTKSDWFETACLAVDFRRGLDDLSVDIDRSSGLQSPASPLPDDHSEWADRMHNSAHGIWVTDKRRKSKRERKEIQRLQQSPTGFQQDRYEPGASGTDENDIQSPDFR